MGKRSTAQARIDNQLRTDFDWALDYTGLGETQFIEAAIKALVEQVREKGEITLPLALIPKSQLRGKDAPEDPPGKSPAGKMQRSAGRADVEAADAGGRSTASTASRPDLSGDAPREIPPVIQARGSFQKRTHVAPLGKQKREAGKKE